MSEAIVREPAPAKVNLFLRVLGRRLDGFHDIETLVQPLTLADGVEARLRDGGLELRVVGEHVEEVPLGEDNLVMRAARALAEAANVTAGASLLIAKRVPVAAGLGGGSSDAAATLRALDRLWGCGLGSDRLRDIAAEIGSDVPALLSGGPVVARGRGEMVEPVKIMRTWWVVVVPAFAIRAQEAYGWWDEDGGPVGADPEELLATLREDDPTTVGPLLFNDLERPAAERHQEIGATRSALLEAGAVGALMCGSGPAVAGLARDGRHAEDLAGAVGGIVAASISGFPAVG